MGSRAGGGRGDNSSLDQHSLPTPTWCPLRPLGLREVPLALGLRGSHPCGSEVTGWLHPGTLDLSGNVPVRPFLSLPAWMSLVTGGIQSPQGTGRSFLALCSGLDAALRAWVLERDIGPHPRLAARCCGLRQGASACLLGLCMGTPPVSVPVVSVNARGVCAPGGSSRGALRG